MADDTPPTDAKPDAKPAPKPRTRRTPAKSADTAAPSKPAAKAPPKPRASKRTAANVTAKSLAKRTAAGTAKRPRKAESTVAKATDKVGGKWGVAAIAGGVAVAGAAAAALLLKGSTPDIGKPAKGAKQADGTDSSASFEAGIADEGSIPNA